MRNNKKDIIAYRKAYYLANREAILKRIKSRYKRKGKDVCKCCGVDIKELREQNNAHLLYCNRCIADKTKVSRQTIWYRNNRFRLRLLRRKGAKK